MSVKLLTEHNLEFLSLKEGCTGSSESSIVEMPHLLEITCCGSFTLSLPVCLVPSVDNFCKQFWTQIRTNILSVLIITKQFDTLILFLKEFFDKKGNFEKSQQSTAKACKNDSACRVQKYGTLSATDVI